MRKCIATVCLSGTLTAKLDAISAARFDAIEVFENDLINFHGSPADLRSMAADRGLGIDLYQPFREIEGVSDEQFKRNLDRAERKFDIMDTLGTSMMLVCASVSPQAIDDDARAAAQLHAMAERAARRNIRARLRGARVVVARQPLRARVEDRARSRASPPRHHPRQLSHPFAGRRSRGDCRHPGRQDLLPADGRRTAAVDGRAAVEPALPQFPGSGAARPAAISRAGARRRLHGTVVARDLQRRLPRSAQSAAGGRRDAVAALSRGADAVASRERRDGQLAPDERTRAYRPPDRALRSAACTQSHRRRVPRVRRRRSDRVAAGQRARGIGLQACRPAPVEERYPVPARVDQPDPQRRTEFVRARAFRHPRSVDLRREPDDR